jgi:signal transduction histidine kinase
MFYLQASPWWRSKNNKLVVKRIGPLGVVSVDQTKLRQVILNLVGNAAKFTENGTISLVAQRHQKQASDWIEIQVHDTGIGITESQLSTLFQDFRQASSATASKYGGSGLGLALSQKLCALMGGGISAVSEVGQGSCFTVRVPAWTVAERQVAERERELSTLAMPA